MVKKQIEKLIKDVEYFHLGRQICICIMTTIYGYEVVGQSGTIKPELYDKEVGQAIAYKRAIELLHKLEAYAVQRDQHMQDQLDTIMKPKVK